LKDPSVKIYFFPSNMTVSRLETIQQNYPLRLDTDSSGHNTRLEIKLTRIGACARKKTHHTSKIWSNRPKGRKYAGSEASSLFK